MWRIVVTLPIVLTVMCAVPACKKGDAEGARGAASPEALMNAYAAAVQARDADALWGLFSDGARTEFESFVREELGGMSEEQAREFMGKDKAALAKMSGKELFAAMANAKPKQDKEPPRLVAVERIDEAHVVISYSHGPAQCELPAVRQGGTWVVESFGTCKEPHRVSDEAEPPVEAAPAAVPAPVAPAPLPAPGDPAPAS
ncbi:MAG: hypothetical protein HY907_19055 [Deltaproteobacteria bacterium]|nr:hypothetical protein [Deltaproteobacteria bacterium]